MNVNLIFSLLIVCCFLTFPGKCDLFNQTKFNLQQIQLLQNGFRGIFWNYLIENDLTNLGVSSECVKSFSSLINPSETLIKTKLKLLDSSGHLPSNLLTSGYIDFGDYDECLTISWNSEDGLVEKSQYCLASFLPENEINVKGTRSLSEPYRKLIDTEFNLVPKIGFCLPSKCSKNDVTILLNQTYDAVSWRLLKLDSCEIQRSWLAKFHSSDASQKLSLVFIAFIVSLVLTATCLDLFAFSPAKHDSSLLSCFSVFKSYRSFTSYNPSEPRVPLLDVGRILTNIVGVTIHISCWFFPMQASFLMNSVFDTIEIMGTPWVQPFLNDWPTEGLLIIGGLTRSCELWSKTKSSTSVRFYLKEIVRKFLLIQYPLLVMMTMNMITPLITTGPMVASLGQLQADFCKQGFWRNVFHIQNFYSPFDMCSIPTWSIAAEFQLYFLLCFLIYFYKKSPKIGLIVNIISLVTGFGLTFRIFYVNNIAPFANVYPFDSAATGRFMQNNYFTASGHVWSYSFCVFVTYLMVNRYHKQIFKTNFIKYFGVILILVMINSFSPILWNVIKLRPSRLAIAVYSVAQRMLTGCFWFSVIIYFGESFYRVFATDEDGTQGSTCKETPVAESNNNKKINLNQVSKSYSRYNHITLILLKLTRSMYVFHVSLAVWFFIRFRRSLNTEEMFLQVILLTIITWAGSFVMYLIFLGPFTNLLNNMKRKRSKTHAE